MIGGNAANNKVTDIGTPLAELASKYVATLRAQAREAMPWAVSVSCLPQVIKVRPGAPPRRSASPCRCLTMHQHHAISLLTCMHA